MPQATIVYDPNQSVCWLANADLAGDAAMRTALGVTGIYANGSMDYATAQRWVAALNAYNNGAGYLGHHDWQLPVAPLVDNTCANTGTGGGSFGPLCTGSALSNLYSVGLQLNFPLSAAPAIGAWGKGVDPRVETACVVRQGLDWAKARVTVQVRRTRQDAMR